MAGGWDDLLARADGLFFFLAIVGSVWGAVWGFSQSRWFAAAAAYVACAVPFHTWHIAAGYSDIAVAAYAVAGLAALLRGEWIVAGLMAAGSAWAKNDGLVLYAPALFLAAGFMSYSGGRIQRRVVTGFLLGCASLAPWLVLKSALSLGVAPGGEKMNFHPEAFRILWDRVLFGPSSNILWVGVLTCVAGCARPMLRDQRGRALLAAVAWTGGSIVAVFSCTEAFTWLENEMTIHRSMMQFAPTAVVVCFYGLWLRLREPESAVSGATQKRLPAG